MGIRTIRMDDDAERLLSRITQTTGMSISTVFKEGLKILHCELGKTGVKLPFDIYNTLDLGPGNYSKAPSTEVKKTVKKSIQRKLGR